jgi:dihydrofolate reductase
MPTETRSPSQSGAHSGQDWPRITLVVAAADDGVIGRDGALPWRLPEDLRRFKAQTLGKPVLMGRRTFESIGRALPGRLNLVLTRRVDWRPPAAAGEVTVVHDWDAALRAAGAVPELMVIGGAEIYALALPRAGRVLLTRVHAAVPGDTRLPPFDPAQWVEVASERFAADERNAIDMTFVELRRA